MFTARSIAAAVCDSRDSTIFLDRKPNLGREMETLLDIGSGEKIRNFVAYKIWKFSLRFPDWARVAPQDLPLQTVSARLQ